jgi:methionyl-tRNA formyltransferase
MERNCIFIGGRQLGVNCLRLLIARGIRLRFLVPEFDDDGSHKGLYESLAAEAKRGGVPVLFGARMNDPPTIGKFQEAAPEIIFHAGGTQLIPKEVIASAKLGCTNLHPALLPKYRGRYSTVHALFNGEKETGVTLHWLDEGMDSGPIIMQEAYPIEESDTGRTLYEKFTRVGTELFGQFLDLWLSGKEIPSQPQNEAEATYYPKKLPNGGQIDWSWDGAKIHRFIRAMTYEPYPPPSFKIGEKDMVIVDKKYFKGFDSR